MPPSSKLLGAVMALSLCAWGIVAWVHLAPRLERASRRDALLAVMTPQMFRTVGVMALFPGIGDAPRGWSVPLAWGDGATAVLAMASMIALRGGWAHATKVAWAATLLGLVDMLHNAVNAVALRVAPQLGPAAYVVAFAVPMMLVFHVLALRALLRREPQPTG